MINHQFKLGQQVLYRGSIAKVIAIGVEYSDFEGLIFFGWRQKPRHNSYIKDDIVRRYPELKNLPLINNHSEYKYHFNLFADNPALTPL